MLHCTLPSHYHNNPCHDNHNRGGTVRQGYASAWQTLAEAHNFLFVPLDGEGRTCLLLLLLLLLLFCVIAAAWLLLLRD